MLILYVVWKADLHKVATVCGPFRFMSLSPIVLGVVNLVAPLSRKQSKLGTDTFVTVNVLWETLACPNDHKHSLAQFTCLIK